MSIEAAGAPTPEEQAAPAPVRGEGPEAVSDAVPARATRRERIIDGILSLLAATLLILAFEGVLKLNKVTTGEFRNYGSDWFDRIPIKETAFFCGVVFLVAPAAIFLARFLWLVAGPPLAAFAGQVRRRGRVVVVLAMVGALAATAIFGWKFVKHTPLTDDENIQLFQARLVESGRIAVAQPPADGPYEMPGLVVTSGGWTGVFPWGHAALIALGDLVGFPWLWPHLAAALLVLLTWLLARELFPDDESSAVIAILLMATSPFLVMTCATLHSGVTSAVLVTLGAWALARHVRRGGLGWALLGGLAFGVDLHVRPYNALWMGGACGVLALGALMRAGKPWRNLAIGFSLGVVPLALLEAVINWQLTGDPRKPALSQAVGYRRLFGMRRRMAYGVSNLPPKALGKLATNTVRVVLWATGSALTGLTVVAAAAGWLKKKSDAWLLFPPLVLLCGYLFFFRSPASDTGPVYFFDLLPFLSLFAARVLVGVRDRLAQRLEPARATGMVVALGAMTVLLAMATFWPVQSRGVRRTARSIRAPYDMVKRADIHQALVWWSPPPGSLSWVTQPRLPHPDFSDDVIFARDTSGKWELMMTLGERKTYQVRYPGGRPTLYEWMPGATEGDAPKTQLYYPLDAPAARRPTDFQDTPMVQPWVPLKPDQFDTGRERDRSDP